MSEQATQITNPVLDFYQGLRDLFLEYRPFQDWLADNLMSIYRQDKDKISLKNVSKQSLRTWYGQVLKEEFAPILDEVCKHAFGDLACQMRNEMVRSFFLKFKGEIGCGSDLFIHIRKLKPLGDGVCATTMVVDDIELFSQMMLEPDLFELSSNTVHMTVDSKAIVKSEQSD